ncbi:hypothetical protein MTO96_037149 [Rhipicephalus appendiculatus]
MELRDAQNGPVNGKVVEKINDRCPSGLPGKQSNVELWQGRGLRARESIVHESRNVCEPRPEGLEKRHGWILRR